MRIASPEQCFQATGHRSAGQAITAAAIAAPFARVRNFNPFAHFNSAPSPSFLLRHSVSALYSSPSFGFCILLF
jgi:hypothetical protein